MLYNKTKSNATHIVPAEVWAAPKIVTIRYLKEREWDIYKLRLNHHYLSIHLTDKHYKDFISPVGSYSFYDRVYD